MYEVLLPDFGKSSSWWSFFSFFGPADKAEGTYTVKLKLQDFQLTSGLSMNLGMSKQHTYKVWNVST